MGARAGAWAAALVVVWGGASLAQAPSPPAAFPRSLERQPLLDWLRRETDITPGQVVAVGASAVTAIVSIFPAANGPGPRVVIRAEATDRAAAARDGALSWHVSLNADCDRRRVQLGETTGYRERNLLGERWMLRPAEPDWRTPEPGTPLESVWRAVCEPGFRRPLEVARLDTAQGPIPTAPREPPQVRSAPPDPASEPPPAEPARSVSQPRAPASGASVQVLASPSEAAARAALARLGPELDGRSGRVERAQVQGRTWYRAIITGFENRAEAGRFCETLRSAGQACFVRPGG